MRPLTQYDGSWIKVFEQDAWCRLCAHIGKIETTHSSFFQNYSFLKWIRQKEFLTKVGFKSNIPCSVFNRHNHYTTELTITNFFFVKPLVFIRRKSLHFIKNTLQASLHLNELEEIESFEFE